MLGILSLDLITVILEEYIGADVRRMSALDVACCGRSNRAELLAVLAHVRSHFPDKSDALKGSAMSNYLQWVSARAMPISQLSIDSDDLAQAADILKNASSTLLRVEKVTLRNNPSDTTCSDALVAFLACLPHLSEFVCSEYVVAVEVARLCGRRLKALHLLTIASPPHMHISENTLKLIRRSMFDDTALIAIAEHCVELKSIHADLGQCSEATIEQAFSKLGRHLEEVSIVCNQLDHSLAHKITSLCPHLTKFALLSNASYRPNADFSPSATLAFDAITQNCPAIRTVQLLGATISISLVNGHDARAQDGTHGFWTPGGGVIQAICSTVPMRSVFLRKLSAAMLRLLAEVIGPNLDAVSGWLADDVDDKVLIDLLSHCPNLITLRMHCALADQITDASLSQIFALCPFISTLKLIGYHRGADAAFLELLQGFQAPCLNRLFIDRFLSSKAVLVDALAMIAQCFPTLIWLKVFDSGGRRYIKSFTMPTTPEKRPWIRGAIRDAGFRVDRAALDPDQISSAEDCF